MSFEAYSLEEMAEELCIDVIELTWYLFQKDHPARKAYRNGFLLRQLELRERRKESL